MAGAGSHTRAWAGPKVGLRPVTQEESTGTPESQLHLWCHQETEVLSPRGCRDRWAPSAASPDLGRSPHKDLPCCHPPAVQFVFLLALDPGTLGWRHETLGPGRHALSWE